MTIFRKTSKRAADLDRVRSEISRLDEVLERYGERTQQVEAELAARPVASVPSPHEAGDGPAVRAFDAAAMTEVNSRIDALAVQLEALEGRITSVSTELANQLSELGNDIDTLSNRPAGAEIDEEALDELRDTQTRLATEQARYQIAFREDLARLAELMRRTDLDPRRRA